MKYLGNKKQLLCVNDTLEEDFVYRSGIDPQLIGKPLVATTLAAQFATYQLTYVDCLWHNV